jgi:transcriptional regulator with XRE-family HTH domain
MQSLPQNPVKAYRIKQKLKVRELAQQWGTSFATLSRIENGVQRIPENLLPKIAEATGKTPAELRPDLVERNERLSEILATEPVQ